MKSRKETSGKEVNIMMKKYVMMLGVMIMSVSVVTGCANKNDQKSAVEQTTSSAVQSQTAADVEASSSTDAEQKTVSGTIETIEDFQFVIYDEDDNYYQFSFEETPKGLDKVKVGDTVMVTYTGTVSEVDPFLGEVISVDKVNG